MSDPIDILRLAADRVTDASAALDASMAMQSGHDSTVRYFRAKLEHEMALRDVQAAMDVAKSLNEFRVP